MELTVTPNAPFGDDHFKKKKKKNLKNSIVIQIKDFFF